MSDLNWCQCGKQTLTESLYCSAACRKADTATLRMLPSEREPIAVSPQQSKDHHYVYIDQSLGTFNFISCPFQVAVAKADAGAQAIPIISAKRPRMNSVVTPPSSPSFAHFRLVQSKNIEPEELYSSLAFSCRKRRI